MRASSKRRPTPVNGEITPQSVRVEVRHGPNLGIMSTAKALAEARHRGCDLVLQAPSVDPPLCEIMDMSRYIYNDEIADLAVDADPCPAHPLASVPIPDDAKSFLKVDGLPNRFMEFQIDGGRRGMLQLDEYVEWWRDIEVVAFSNTCRRLGREPDMYRYFIQPNPVELFRFYRIGEMDFGLTLSVESISGNVYAIDIAGFQTYDPPGFINSSVMLFAEFVNFVSNVTDADRRTVRSKLRALDPRAMVDPDRGFWSTLVEQIEDDIW